MYDSSFLSFALAVGKTPSAGRFYSTLMKPETGGTTSWGRMRSSRPNSVPDTPISCGLSSCPGTGNHNREKRRYGAPRPATSIKIRTEQNLARVDVRLEVLA